MNCIVSNARIASQDNGVVSGTLERIEEINRLVAAQNLPEGFELDEEGVWYFQQGSKEIDPPTRVFLCDPLWITAYTRDDLNENHGRVLEFSDVDGVKHVWSMPMELLASDGAKILAKLYSMGLRIAPQKRLKDRLLEYISLCDPIQRARCAPQTGWFHGVYVLPSETIGYIQKEKVIYQNSWVANAENVRGTIEDWQDKIALKASGNSRLVLALSASFTGPILNLMNHENIGIHFRGGSSLGKSTTEIVANSVWESKEGIYSFRATANGLEGIAGLHNDRLLCLDELGQVSSNDAGEIAYMLGNGMGKTRSTRNGDPRKAVRWRLVFISNGELSLAQHMEAEGKQIKAGQEVRLVEIFADTGVHGIFENLNGFENGDVFSKYFQDICSELYGTASREFLTRLVQDIDGSIDYIKTVISGIKQRYLPEDSCGQVTRVFNHFALIAATGELASFYGITGWRTEEALIGVMKCFSSWLEARGGSGMREEQQALTHIRKFFERDGESRFSSWNRNSIEESKTINRAGFKRHADNGEVEFFVYPNTFRKEVCSGLDYHYVEKICMKNNILMPAADGSPTRSERLPGCNKTTRCYRFTSEVLSG